MKFCIAPNCNNPVFGKSYCRNHQYMRADFDKRSITQRGIDKHKKEQQNSNIKSKVRGLSSLPSNKEMVSSKDVELEVWFIHRAKECKGVCFECGGKSTKGDPKYWKYSICHILPKSLFPSIRTHVLNFVELCYFGNSHHSNMDNNGYEYVQRNMPKTWALIVQRFNLMYPSIKEKSKIPDILIQELEPTTQE